MLLDRNVSESLVSAEVHAKYIGSDHCPVSADISLSIEPSQTVPLLCSSVRYRAKQQKLTMFIKKGPNVSQKDIFDTISTQTSKSTKPTVTNSSKKRKSENTLKGFVKQAKISERADSTGEEVLSQRSSQDSKSQSQENKKQSSQTLVTKSDGGAAFLKKFSKGKKTKVMCTGHNEVTVLQTVKKEGENKGRKFYACARGVGAPGNIEARCSYFKWADEL